MAEITEDELNDLARTPQRVRTAEGAVEERTLTEIIKADRYLASKTAAATPNTLWGLRFARTVGTTGPVG